MTLRHLNPPALPDWSPLFSQIVVGDDTRRIIAISGQVGVGPDKAIVGDGSFPTQVAQAFVNLHAALAAADATFGDVARLTIYAVGYTVAHADVIATELRRHFGRDPRPALTLLGVQCLGRPEFLVEIEALAFK